MVSRPLVMSQAKATIQVSLPTDDRADEPFAIGSIVCLKTAPSRHYTVEAVQANVDTDSNEGHIKNPDGGAQHFYRLRNQSGGVAFWWHSQLELAF